MRKYYLDDIRWATVVLVVVYHVFYMFNACGVLGGVGSFAPVQPQDIILPFVYPWFMVLLFAVAGMSARYALERKTVGEFVRSRTVKLLVPSTLGLLVFQWLVGWLNISLGGGMEYMAEVPGPILYLIFAVSGVGPLWFAQVLWLFSLVLALIHILDRDGRLYSLCRKASPIILIPLCLPIWGGAQIGNVPVLTTYRFGIYGAAFLIGHYILSQEKMQEMLKRLHLPLLALALATGIAYAVYWFGQDYSAGRCLRSFFTNLYAWIATLAALGCFKAWCGKSSPFTQYMRRSSFGLYVLHYLPTLLSAWALKSFTALPVPLIYLLCIAAGLLGGLGLWEVLQRVPFVRWAVLGIRKERTVPTPGKNSAS